MDHSDSIKRIEIRHYLWRRGDLSWKLHDTQKVIHQKVDASRADEVLILSSRQLGKSWWVLCYALEFCIKNPGAIVRVLAATLKQIQDIVNDNLVHIISDCPAEMIQRQKSSYRWDIGRSSLRLGPLERAYVDYNRGGNASLIICEEGGFVKSEDYEYAVKSVIGPQLLRTSGKLIHVTTPSQDPLHFIHTETLPKTTLSDSCYRYSIYDNPQLSEEQIEKAKILCGGEDTATWHREYLAEIVRDPSTIIVPTFDHAAHVKEFNLPTWANYFTCIDWGGVRDKTVGLIYTYDFQRNKVLFIDEFVANANTPTDQIVRSALLAEETYFTSDNLKARWVDAAGQTQVDLHNLHKFPVRLPLKDDWQAGINNMQILFSRNEIEVHPRCKFLIQSLESGQYNQNRTDFARSDILGHCDALAACMYALRMLDKSMPQSMVTRSGSTFRRPDGVQKITLSDSLSPKQFGKFRR